MKFPATPGWVSLSALVGAPHLYWLRAPGAVSRHSWLGSAGGGGVWCVTCGVWCVVCGVRRWSVRGVVAGVWCGWSLATPGGGSCVLLPATPKEGPYQDRPQLCPFRLLPLPTCS